MAVRGRFLDEMDYLAPREDERLRVENAERLLGMGGGNRVVALALVALAEHLEARPSLPRPEPARAATEGERCSPLPSGGGEPSEEEIRVVAEKIAEMAATANWGKPWNNLCADAAIRALDEYRARRRG